MPWSGFRRAHIDYTSTFFYLICIDDFHKALRELHMSTSFQASFWSLSFILRALKGFKLSRLKERKWLYRCPNLKKRLFDFNSPKTLSNGSSKTLVETRNAFEYRVI